RVEQPAPAARVLAGPDRALEGGQHPDDPPFRGVLGDLADASLELADVRLTGRHVGRAGLEDEPALLLERAERLADHGRLADAVLADDERRPLPRLPQRRPQRG